MYNMSTIILNLFSLAHKLAGMKGKPLVFRPTPELRSRIERLAVALDRDYTWLIEKAVEGYLPTLEERYAKELRELEKSHPSQYRITAGQYMRTEDRPAKESSSSKGTPSKVQNAVKRGLERIAASAPPKAPKQ